MILKPILHLAVSGLCACPAFAAGDTTFYDRNWKMTSRTGAEYFRPPARLKNGLFHFRDYYMSGALQCEGQFSNLEKEVREGLFRFYTPDGVLEAEERFRRGYNADSSVHYYQGRIVKSMRYIDTLGTSHCRVFDSSNGRLLREGMESRGVGFGTYRMYTPGGSLFRTADLENGKFNGCGRYFDTLSGKVIMELCFLAGQRVSQSQYASNGNLYLDVSVHDNKREGTLRQYDTVTKRLAGIQHYRNDSVDGLSTFYNEDCDFVRQTAYFAKGKPEGRRTVYFRCSDQVYTTSDFKEGRAEGLYTIYDRQTGQRVAEGNHVNGKEDGVWKYYFPDGRKLRMVKNFRSGKLDGPLQTWWPSGTLRREEQYAEGVRKSWQCYGEDGKDTAFYPLVVRPSFLKNPQYYFDQWLETELGTSLRAKIYVAVDPDKNISSVRVLSSDHPDLNDAIRKIAADLPVVVPGTEDGMPYASGATFDIALNPGEASGD